MRDSIACLCAAVLLHVPAFAQSGERLVSVGDSVPGVGSVTALDVVSLSDDGGWIAEADTNAPDVLADAVLLLDGALAVREGAPFPASPVAGTTIGVFQSIALAPGGDVASVAGIRMPFGGSLADALLWNSTLLALENDPIAAPPFGTGTFWLGFEFVEVEHRNVLVRADVADPSVPGARENALVLYELDASGAVLSTTVLATKGQQIAGSTVTSIASSALAHARNRAGRSILTLSLSNPSPQLPSLAVVLDRSAVVARQGQPSSVGINWLVPLQADLNDLGDHAVGGRIDGDQFLIEKNGVKLVRDGDVLPQVSALPLQGPQLVDLTNDRAVFWRTGFAGSTESALVRDRVALVVTNSTVVDGFLVTDIDADPASTSVSPDGRYVASVLELQGLGDALVRLDLGLVFPIYGCVGNLGRLALASGGARVGASLELALDDGHVPGAIARVVFSAQPRIAGSECGVFTPAGEVLISPAHRLASVFAPPWDGANPTSVTIPIPNDLALLDLTLYAQGNFRTPGTRTLSLTNALRIEIGAP